MNRLKDLRKAQKLSQEELAIMVKCATATISKYEKGQRKIPDTLIPQLCEIFDCTSDYLLGLSDKNAKKPAANDSGQEVDIEEFKRLQEVNELFLGLDEAGKAQARAYLRFLSAQQEKQSDSQN